jgi:hypothetical protein
MRPKRRNLVETRPTERREPAPGDAPKPPAPWRAPAELQRCTPRPVRLSFAGRAAFAGMLALLAGAVALAVILDLGRERSLALKARLNREGVAAQGRVVSTGMTREEHKRAYIVYSYSAGGMTYQKRVTLHDRDARKFPIGSSVPVRFLPEEPGKSWALGYEPDGIPLLVVILLPPYLAIWAPLLGWMLDSQRRLLSEGRVAEARVAASRKTYAGHHAGYKVEYEFQILSGANRRVTISASKKPPQPGASATILYDRENPRRIAVYPLPLVRVADFGR